MFRLLVILLVIIPVIVQAQLACSSHDVMIAMLGDKYGEVRRGTGLSGPTAIYEIWASDTTGTWTILMTIPNGWSCVMAEGSNWEDDDPPPLPTY